MAERVRETINVNDFSSLIGSNLRSSINLQGHSNRKEDEELQEQIRCYRAEVLRKKELLNELLVAENEVNVEQNPAMSRASSFYGDLVSQYRTVADEARAENASLQVRIANLEKNASILAEEIKVKDAVVSEHKKQVEKLQENNVRQISLISSLRQSIKDLEMKADEFEQEYRERLSVVNERVEDSNLLKKNLEELQELCENKNAKIEELERELATTRQQLSNTNSVICDALEMRDQQTSLESITAIIRKIITERNQIEDELNKVKVEFADCDNERRAGRETIMRLVAEAESKNLSASANADVLVKQANDDKMRIQYLEQQVASLSSKASELQQDLDAALCDFDELKQQKMKSRAPSTVVNKLSAKQSEDFVSIKGLFDEAKSSTTSEPMVDKRASKQSEDIISIKSLFDDPRLSTTNECRASKISAKQSEDIVSIKGLFDDPRLSTTSECRIDRIPSKQSEDFVSIKGLFDDTRLSTTSQDMIDNTPAKQSDGIVSIKGLFEDPRLSTTCENVVVKMPAKQSDGIVSIKGLLEDPRLSTTRENGVNKMPAKQSDDIISIKGLLEDARPSSTSEITVDKKQSEDCVSIKGIFDDPRLSTANQEMVDQVSAKQSEDFVSIKGLFDDPRLSTSESMVERMPIKMSEDVVSIKGLFDDPRASTTFQRVKNPSRAFSKVDIDFQAFAEFREELAAIISHDFRFVDADRVTILRAIKEILTKLKVAEGRTTTTQNESGFDEIMMRAVSAEHKVRDLMEQLSQLQTQMEMNESRGDSFHLEYALFMTFIKKLNVILKLESIIPELGLDMNLEAIINRCELLNKKESEVIAEKSSQLNMLQRKHKRLKEELEGKELHLDMLRKKVSQLEEKLAAYIAKPPEVTEFEIKFRKSQKINERLRGQLGDARLHIVELKEEASKYKDAHIQSLDNNDKFAQLVQKIQELEKIKNKQAKQLAGMKQETEYLQLEAKSRIESREESLGSLAEEVRNTKMALDEVARREKQIPSRSQEMEFIIPSTSFNPESSTQMKNMQLQDFKGVVAKMVGLDVCQLSVPDYEIISRLERMVSNTMDDGKRDTTGKRSKRKKRKRKQQSRGNRKSKER